MERANISTESLEQHDGNQKFFRVETLPQKKYGKLWNAIHLEPTLKQELYNAVMLQAVMRGVPPEDGGMRGILLLIGDPGVGKTTLAQGMANLFAELGQRRDGGKTALFEARASQWFSEWVGKNAKTIDGAFARVEFVAARQRVVMLFDEIDSLATNRAKLSTGELMTPLRGCWACWPARSAYFSTAGGHLRIARAVITPS